MFEPLRTKVVIPALNEAEAIGKVLSAVPAWVDEVIVADNGSTDDTAARAKAGGARVIHEPRRGYGQACLSALAAMGDCDVVVFLDGDYSDYPEDMADLVGPIASGEADFVLGSRTGGGAGPESLTPQQRVGNALACFLMKLLWRGPYTDLGPFRAIRAGALRSLKMCDRNYGWTVEMQIKALRAGLRVREVPVRYRPRIGTSKVSGMLRGVLGAGAKILGTIARHAVAEGPPRRVSSERVILFSRYPLPGTAKTRLIPTLGPCGAARLQQRMTKAALATAREAARDREAEVEVRYAGGDAGRMRRWLGPGCRYVPQGAGDLGARMARAIRDALSEGAERVVVIGSDCPHLRTDHLREALSQLARHDLVLGPSEDGGYWLIAMNRFCPVFEDVPWGGPSVLEATGEHARRLGLRVHLLEELRDVDTPDDLGVAGFRGPDSRPWLSVIVPARNEEAEIAACLRSAKADDVEILVVDGGSEDATVRRASQLGARVLACPPGRARQMNRGAEAAHGRVLLFLHADTRLPRGYEAEVFDALSDPRVKMGSFRFRTDNSSLSMTLVSWGADVRSRRFGLPYGDQALFVRREAFEGVGGFPGVPVAEDLCFVLRMLGEGRVSVTDSRVVTSARMWQSAGHWRNSAVNGAILVGCLLGFPPAGLARIHRIRQPRDAPAPRS